ncbi:FAD/NAD(P)-binding domain-containing protein [Boletus edulis]|uniref:FAD/NAD(P)-binding domain-containing protein n=1 Tax=Boletus edulis BED1 TaxID=1328754 RepID=A0AAD4GIA4_BOLED|nr:FAD/NAD(P)-binding domain-containing protein [Boletus edulis]KAF8445603.1 FAD/NAD(P)-binding domain-containing protein [Boletus edulis BED1]
MSIESAVVVVVGAGFAGTTVVSALSSKLDSSKYHIVLINPRPYAIPLPASLRLIVSEAANLERTALVPLDRIYRKASGEIKIGIVKSIEPKDAQSGGHVVLETGERIPYEILIIASGSIWKGPIEFPLHETDVLPHIRTWRSKFANANHTVIVGGGALGVELAGELKDEYPGKRVTIVQGDRQLLNSTYPSSFRRGLATRLLARGIELLFNEYVDSFPEQGSVGLVTRKGTEIPDADLVVSARGPSPNTAFAASLGSSTLSPSGFIRVKPTLQVVDHPRIFAVGDVIEWPEQKQAAKVAPHAKVVVQNVLNVLAGENDALVSYQGSAELIVITNGRNGGMSYFPFLGGITLGDFWTRLLKSRGLMIVMFTFCSNLGY